MAAFTHADVAEVARMHRADGCTPSFRHGTATKPLSGKQCMIYSLGFPNGDSWAVRIPSLMRHLPAAAIANYVEAEARILKDLEAGLWEPDSATWLKLLQHLNLANMQDPFLDPYDTEAPPPTTSPAPPSESIAGERCAGAINRLCSAVHATSYEAVRGPPTVWPGIIR
ncbi:hypothetical protein GQ53DRAFT_834778 [Thozetella sp. PMI_491]|nr:hypothetical protein GQ53DRAFT_834778 [Thozetella sp. PMI_491]